MTVQVVISPSADNISSSPDDKTLLSVFFKIRLLDWFLTEESTITLSFSPLKESLELDDSTSLSILLTLTLSISKSLSEEIEAVSLLAAETAPIKTNIKNINNISNLYLYLII